MLKGVMRMANGWWELNIEMDDEITDADLEHIAEQIKNGFTSGQLVH